MPPGPSDGLSVEELDGLATRATAPLVEHHGVARWFSEPPFSGSTPHVYLTERVVNDAARDDASTFAAMRDGQMVGLVVLRFPQWDREHFGFRVGRVEHLLGTDSVVLERLAAEVVRQLTARGARVCSARLSNDASAALRSLEASGFSYVELMLAPWRDLSDWEPRVYGVTREARAGDVESMCAAARAAFRTDRFHRDPRFDRDAADGLYERWVRTWVADRSSARHTRVLDLDGRVVAFFLYEVTDPTGDDECRVAQVVLNGIDPAYAGQGHGLRMYCDALDDASRRARYCTADVSAANPAVINLYAKLGFRLTSTGDVTMHWWAED
jgi:ribosomal protein S18 acetylase RimI-like enzyme